jgi:uncharacterized membrane protein YdjX (TVP38/TMEM64 family)
MQGASRVIRLVALGLLIGAIVAAAAWFTFTEQGHYLTHHPHETGKKFQEWVAGHRTVAPLTYIALFVLLCVLMLPVWWLQILAGYGFGMIMGVVWTELGATLGALAAMMISRWIAYDWFHRRVESRLKKLRDLDEKMGHNGFLVVIAIRLMHFMPVGISNYVFGVTTITPADVAVGTVLGGLPVVTWWVAIGADLHPWRNTEFLFAIVVMHVVLLVPLVLRYLKPQWFRRYGIE